MSTRLRLIALIVLGLISCGSTAYVDLETPPRATNIERSQVTGTASRQTESAYAAEFSSVEVIDFYKNKLGKDWRYCEWGPPIWFEFMQSGSDGPVVVHQQLRMWLNETEKESVALAVRYYSDKTAQGKPTNSSQHVLLTQNTVLDFQDTKTALSLKCY